MTNPMPKQRPHRRTALRLSAAAAVLCLTAGAGTATAAAADLGAGQARRGAVVSVTPLALLDARQATAGVRDAGFVTPPERGGVELERVVYRTVTPEGRPTTASGLVALPRDPGPRALTTVEYAHGTMAYRGEAPSVADGPDRAEAVMFAGDGFAAVAPDYLGLGVGPGTHPYLDAPSETTASTDLLIAARQVEARHGMHDDGRVLVTGFSEGGAAAMSIGRALQHGQVPGYRLTALAPVSGPYDLTGSELPAALNGRLLGPDATFYAADLVVAWNRLHSLYGSPSEAFQAPYDRTVTALFDGEHTDAQVAAALPDRPQRLFTPAFLQQLQHPTGKFAQMFRMADSVCQWAPQVPVRLYDADGDRDVAPANTLACKAQLAHEGVDAPLVDAGATDHNGSAFASYPLIRTWFDALAGH
ncbi:alpha/beta hydrolase family protein [Kitasatospora sp. NPDC006697]|uniref:alpha/beta hydrolase family protein n=1 Tax=Kitasatospora sp. NPDC006697 TaxID=3364020 RepID=UPI0036B6177C